jgi:uncharacterized protein
MNGHFQTVDLQKIVAEVKSSINHLFDASVVAHDMSHLERVCKVGDTICVSDGGNRITVAAASFLHDYHRFIEKKIGRHVSPEEAEPDIRALLENIRSIPPELHDSICDAINFTEYYRCAGDDLNEKNSNLEARIVRDADMLDAIGAVGIARAFMFGGFLGEPMWVPDGSTVKDAKMFVHGKTSSVVHHFHEKLLKLECEMLTHQGRVLAAERSTYMRQFVDKLMSEIA